MTISGKTSKRGEYLNEYEELIDEAARNGLSVREAPLQSGDGRCRGKKIAIRKDIPTLAQKADILAEELGHHYTTVGNILNLEVQDNRKQERAARLWAYNKRIGLPGLIEAYKHGCYDQHTTSEFLNVSEEFLQEAIDCYREKYGEKVAFGNYTIQFEPHLQIISPYDEIITIYTRNKKKLSYQEKVRLARIILAIDD